MQVNKLRIGSLIMKKVTLKIAILAVCTAGVLMNFAGDSRDNSYTSINCDKEYIALPIDLKNLTYRLHTRHTICSPAYLKFCEKESIKKSDFKMNKDIVFIVHDQAANCFSESTMHLIPAFLNAGDFNVICIDWGAIAEKYSRKDVAIMAPAVGRALGLFIMWLTTLGVSFNRVQLVGFGLGGHVVGNAGRATNGQVRRITALNPSPNSTINKNRLSKTDGQYVEVIHTHSDERCDQPCGHADFYPNGGKKMPGCGNDAICSHNRAFHYMAATLEHNSICGKKCKNLEEALNKKCCGETYHMGNAFLNKTGSGIYGLKTSDSYPYY